MIYYLYILTNKNNTVLYIGLTNNLKRRIVEHKNGENEGFSKKYNCNKLIWFEKFSDIKFAIEKEKRMKKWKREYKVTLINEMNPNWEDFYHYL